MDALSALPTAYQSATTTIRKAVDKVAQDAHLVANSTSVEDPETLAALIDGREQLLYTKAAAKLISTTNDMVGTLVDDLA